MNYQKSGLNFFRIGKHLFSFAMVQQGTQKHEARKFLILIYKAVFCQVTSGILWTSMLIVLPFTISVLLGNEQDPRYIYKFSNHLRKARLNKNTFFCLTST